MLGDTGHQGRQQAGTTQGNTGDDLQDARAVRAHPENTRRAQRALRQTGQNFVTTTHISDSLHIYHDKHKLRYLDPPTPADDDIPNHADIRLEYPEWERQWNVLTEIACELIEATDSARITDLLTKKTELSPGYQEWVHLLCAEALRKIGNRESALQVVASAGPYWSKSWLKWYWRPKNQKS